MAKILMKQELDLRELKTIDLQDIKAIFIDVDDTLYSYKVAHPLALLSCYKLFREYFLESSAINIKTFEQFEATYRSARNNVTKRLLPGSSCRSRLLAFQEMFESFMLKPRMLGYKYAIEFEELYWSSLIDNIIPNVEMKNFLEFCQNKIPNLIICAVSDMQAAYQIRKLNKMDYSNFFLVTSEEVGVEKPDSLIFNYALQKFDLDPKEVIMIGDSYEKDIIGASRVGIRAFLININD
jgi:HAD superfamily hydrolase (TIGR01509 family)